MEVFRSILVPVDGSAHSQRALKRAIYLAGLCQAKIVLLHVVDIAAKISSFEQVNLGGYIPDNIKDDGRAILQEALQQVPPAIKAEMFLEMGAPPKLIVSFCQENGYDLIVMGSRGIGAVKQLLVGSVSNFVIQRAPCPVMVVR